MEVGRREMMLGAAALATTAAAPPPRPAGLRVTADGHRFETDARRPFFWLADTAWDLAWRTTRAEAERYLAKRAAQGFTVIQMVALAESSDLRTPSDVGLLPFADRDPARPDPRFFDHIDWLLRRTAAHGLRVALLPCWGDKVTAPWGIGPRLFRLDNLPTARGYGRFLAARLRGHRNLIWMLGGDRPARLAPGPADWWARRAAVEAGWPADADWRPIWRALAEGLIAGAGPGPRPLIGYHPQGGPESTASMLPDEPWLDFHGVQSGHGGGHDSPGYEWVARDYRLDRPKPVLDLEINYEDHPVDPWPVWNPANGYFRAADVRAQAYRTVFAGAAGVTYGHHAVWQFAGPRHPGINHTDRDWTAALDRPGAWQLRHLRRLIEQHGGRGRPLPAAIADNGVRDQRAEALCGPGWLLAYLPPARRTITLDPAALPGGRAVARWFDPRHGTYLPPFRPTRASFVTPGPEDWVLAVEAGATRPAD